MMFLFFNYFIELFVILFILIEELSELCKGNLSIPVCVELIHKRFGLALVHFVPAQLAGGTHININSA